MPLATNQQFFVGLVTSSDAGTYTISVETFGPSLKSPMQGIPLAGVFATTLGFKECPQYPIGASVLCYFVDITQCYILGIIPDNDIGDMQSFARTALKTADGNFDKQNIQGYDDHATKKALFAQGRPTDVVEGEHVIMNDFGVLLGLFQTMATLKASELSQIQCYLLDDLVRIVSHNYEHFTAMGEFKVWHDGKAIIAELGATHLSGESIGVPQVTDVNTKTVFQEEEPPGNGGTDEQDYYKISEDQRIKAIERLKLFVGRLGDFLHMFIVRPDEQAVRALAGEMSGKHDTGMADVHFALDGRISVRSVTGIAVEKTNWIMVPQRVRNPEDPQGDEVDDIDFEDKDPFKFDDSHKVRNNPSLYFLQMRDCNAYLQDLYNYKNFLKYEKDFKLSKDPNSNETKLSDIKKVDPNTPVNLSNYMLRRSGLYLMDNGGIMLKDAWGSALVLEGGHMYLQTPGDVLAQPLRNYIVKAGKFASIASRKDIDISSSEESLRIKTKKLIHLYSHEQGIILQSESDNPAEPAPEDEAYTDFGGILFKSKTGVYTYGEHIFDRANDSALYKANHLMLEAIDEQLNIKSKSQLTLTSTDSIAVCADSGINVISQDSLILIGANSCLLGGGSTDIGRQGDTIGMVPTPGQAFPSTLDGVLPIDDLVSIGVTIGDEINNQDFQEQMVPFTEDDKFTKIKFRFLKSEKYDLGDSNLDNIPMTIAQQDDEAFGFLKLSEWTEPEINETLPFPGKEKFEQYYVTSEVKNLQKLQNDIFSKDSESLAKEPGQLSDKSLQQYKVVT